VAGGDMVSLNTSTAGCKQADCKSAHTAYARAPRSRARGTVNLTSTSGLRRCIISLASQASADCAVVKHQTDESLTYASRRICTRQNSV